MGLKVGFTGTRRGMTQHQFGLCKELADVLIYGARAVPGKPEWHHGGQAGADRESHVIAHALGYVCHVHPCPGVSRLGYVAAGIDYPDDVWHEVFPPLTRDRIIAEEVGVLIAAPESDKEVQRSGSWATIRYAYAAGAPVIHLPRGTGVMVKPRAGRRS